LTVQQSIYIQDMPHIDISVCVCLCVSVLNGASNWAGIYGVFMVCNV